MVEIQSPEKIAVIILKLEQYEPQHDKTNKMCVRPGKTQISLSIRWAESSLGAHSFCWFCHVAAGIVLQQNNGSKRWVYTVCPDLSIQNLGSLQYIRDLDQRIIYICSVSVHIKKVLGLGYP